MTKPESGEHYAVKLTGILHPAHDGCVFAFLMADTQLSEIKNPRDLSSKGPGLRISHSLKFLDEQPGADPPAAAQPDLAEALQTLALRLQQAHAQRDAETVLQITRGLLPNEEQILAALVEDVSAEDRAKVLELHAKLPQDEKSLLNNRV